ncbi:MAG: hypothetical protein M3463_03940, partial [Verrucomicrobiota bacterium]|nr:hypothetical protein [Verrucomicrobiota bacterium]
MKLKFATRELHPRRPFRIARARRHAVRNVFVQIEADGVTGFGEAAPSAYYHETTQGVAARLGAVAPMLAGLRVRSGKDLAETWEAAWELLAPSRAAQCAIDLALWDWLGKQEGATAGELAWG